LALRGGYERDPDDPSEPSENALLGAIMESEHQAATLLLVKLTRKAWFK
jgi:hypothetical protein